MDNTHNVEAVHDQVRKYFYVFGALLVLTLLTVAISYLRLPVVPAIIAAMVVASFKGSLVGSFFMHLISERKVIYLLLIFTAIFFLGLMILPVAHLLDPGANVL